MPHQTPKPFIHRKQVPQLRQVLTTAQHRNLTQTHQTPMASETSPGEHLAEPRSSVKGRAVTHQQKSPQQVGNGRDDSYRYKIRINCNYRESKTPCYQNTQPHALAGQVHAQHIWRTRPTSANTRHENPHKNFVYQDQYLPSRNNRTTMVLERKSELKRVLGK